MNPVTLIPRAEIDPEYSLRPRDQNDAPNSLGEVFKAAAEDGIVRAPTRSMIDASMRWEVNGQPVFPLMAQSEQMSSEQANAEFGIPGKLKFDAPIRRMAAERIAQLKRDELERQQVMQYGPGGIGQFATQLAGGAAGGLADPINLAATFLPLGIFARAGAVVEGLTASRLAATVAEQALQGAAGAALLEPMVYFPAIQEHADYSFADSALNILMGGGLGAVGGAIGYGIGKMLPRERFDLTPDTKASVLLHAVSSIENGEAPRFTAQLLDLDREKIRADIITGKNMTAAEFESWKLSLGHSLESTIGLDRFDTNRRLAESMAHRLDNADLERATTLLNPNFQDAAVSSARSLATDIATNPGLSLQERKAGVEMLSKFIDAVNEYHGYRAYEPINIKVEDLGKDLAGHPTTLDAELSKLHPAVQSVTEGIDLYKAAKASAVEAVTNPDRVPLIATDADHARVLQQMAKDDLELQGKIDAEYQRRFAALDQATRADAPIERALSISDSMAPDEKARAERIDKANSIDAETEAMKADVADLESQWGKTLDELEPETAQALKDDAAQTDGKVKVLDDLVACVLGRGGKIK